MAKKKKGVVFRGKITVGTTTIRRPKLTRKQVFRTTRFAVFNPGIKKRLKKEGRIF